MMVMVTINDGGDDLNKTQSKSSLHLSFNVFVIRGLRILRTVMERPRTAG